MQISIVFDPDVRIFASRFWGFSPDLHPAVTFGLDGNRDRLLKLSRAQDLILFVGTMGFPTDEAEQGRLLGLAQFGRTPVNALDIIEEATLPAHSFKNGQYKWPKALAMLRAWRFDDPRPLLVDVLQRQLPMYATTGVVELDEIDRIAVLQLPISEVAVRDSIAATRLVGLREALKNNKPTTGPNAASWSGEVTRDVSGQAQTYALQFEKTDIWKIGWAIDASLRCKEVNKHVPSEILGQEWRLKLTQNWKSGEEAFAMEQRLFALLAKHRTVGERLKCKEGEVSSAWHNALVV
jgi:hypothetical protein